MSAVHAGALGVQVGALGLQVLVLVLSIAMRRRARRDRLAAIAQHEQVRRMVAEHNARMQEWIA